MIMYNDDYLVSSLIVVIIFLFSFSSFVVALKLDSRGTTHFPATDSWIWFEKSCHFLWFASCKHGPMGQNLGPRMVLQKKNGW